MRVLDVDGTVIGVKVGKVALFRTVERHRSLVDHGTMGNLSCMSGSRDCGFKALICP